MVIHWASAGLTSLQPSSSCACSAGGPSSREHSVKVRRRVSCQQLLGMIGSVSSLAAHWSGKRRTASCTELMWSSCRHWSGQGRAASCTEMPPQTRGNLLSRSALNSSRSTITSTLVCASTQSSVCSAIRHATSGCDSCFGQSWQASAQSDCLGKPKEAQHKLDKMVEICTLPILVKQDLLLTWATHERGAGHALRWQNRELLPHRALLRGPISKALSIPLVYIHSLIAMPRSPGIVVQVAHHLCLDLQGRVTRRHVLT